MVERSAPASASTATSSVATAASAPTTITVVVVSERCSFGTEVSEVACGRLFEVVFE